MRIKDFFRRTRSHRVAYHDKPTAVVERSKSGVALVIAEPEISAVMSELYQARGYDVFVPETSQDVIETLAAVGNQVRAVFISSDAAWAIDLRELIADQCPEIDRIMLLS